MNTLTPDGHLIDAAQTAHDPARPPFTSIAPVASMAAPPVPSMPDVGALLETTRKLELEGRSAAALDLFRQWLSQNPNGPTSFLAWYEFGRVLQNTRAFVQAENAFRSVLEQKASLYPAAIALGAALEAQGRIDEAIAVWQSTLQPDPVRVELMNNIGRVLDANFRFEPAEEVLLQSLATNKAQADVIATIIQLRQRMCRWPVIDAEIGVPVETQETCIGPLTSLALIDDPVKNLASARQFLTMKSFDQAYPAMVQRGQFYPGHERLRVGFLSADFRLHATSIFFAPIIEGLDRSRFEVYGFDLTTIPDPLVTMRERLIRGFDHHVPLQTLRNEEAAAEIRAAEIDILVDMSGLTSGAHPEIVARRPAPVQIAYLGFLGSCGIPTVDYLMTARGLFPDECPQGFSEKPLYLPGVYFTVDPTQPALAQSSRSVCGLPEDATVYCALMNSYKINPATFSRWMKILEAGPGSVLWLVEENPTARRNLIAHARDMGADPERLIFSQRIHPAEYRARLRQADLFLDTSPYGNGATAHDAVLADLPILTRPGNTMMSRLSAHMMRGLGLHEFVVADWDAYEQMAIELGRDRQRLARYREAMRLARATSPLFDTPRFVREFGETLLAAVDEVSIVQRPVRPGVPA